MVILRSISYGLRTAFNAPRLLAWLWLVLVLAALPASLAMRDSVAESLGGSRAALALRDRIDLGWLGEYQDGATGFEKSLTEPVLARTAFLYNLEALFSGRLFEADKGLVGMGVLYALLWALLLGGVLDRLLRGAGRFMLAPFLMAGGRYFFRFVRLTAMAGVVYFGLYRLAGWLFHRIELSTRDVTAETTILRYDLAAALCLLFLFCVVNMVFDYAKIASVLEERASALRSLGRGLRFVGRHPFAALAVYLVTASVGALVLVAHFLTAPGPGQSSWSGVITLFLVGQVFLVARLGVRLAFFGGQLHLYRALRNG